MPKYTMPDGNAYDFPDDAEATRAMKAWDKQFKTPEKETSLDMGKALASGFAQTGNTVDRYISQLGLAPLNYINPDEADKHYKAMEDRIASRNQWANPENTPLSMPEKVVSAVGNLPGMMLSMPMSPATAGAEAINAGESLPRAMGAAAIDTVGNTLGMGLGPMGPNVGARVASSAVINAAQDYATKAATQQLMQTERGKKAFEPTLEDAAVSGIVGGGFGFMKPQGKETKSSVRSKLVDAAQEKPITPAVDPNIELYKAHAAKLQEEARNRVAGLIEDKVTPDRDAALIAEIRAKLSEQGQLPIERTGTEANTPLPKVSPEFLAEPRVGELGTNPRPEMPAPAHTSPVEPKLGPVEKSFDGQNQLTPVRGDGRLSNLPNLDTGFGFEPKRPAPSNFAGQVEATRAAREAAAGTIDFPGRVEHLTGDPMVQQMLRELDQRKSELPRMEVEKAKGGKRAAEIAKAQREVEARISELEANLRDHGWTGEPMSGKQGFYGFGKKTLAPIQKTKIYGPKGQKGAYNPAVFAEGFSKVYDSIKKGIRYIATGKGDALNIEAFDRNGDRIGGAQFTPQDMYAKPSTTDLTSKMTGVDKDFRKKGIAAEMYKFAASLGNDISPSKARTAEGRAMWEGFEKKGIAEKQRIYGPTSQRGMIDPDLQTLGVTKLITRIGSTETWNKFKSAFGERAVKFAESDSKDPKSRSRLMWVSPRTFLRLAADRGGIFKPDEGIRTALKSKEGLESIPQLWIHDGKVEGHEGRHRMDVFQAEGLDKVPVIVKDSMKRNEAGPLPYETLMPEGGTRNPIPFDFLEEVFPTGDKVFLPQRMRGSVEGMGNSTLLKAWDRLTSKKSEDPVTQHSSNVDLAAAGGKLPGVGKAFNGIDIPPAEPKSFLEYAKDWISDKSSDLSWGEKTRGVTTTAGANLLAKATKNPLVATVFHQIDNANRVSEALIKQHAQPLSSTARHMDKAEFSDIVYALQLKEGKGEWTKQQLLNSGMSEKQANWIMDFYKVDKLALEATNADRVARGLKPVDARTAHMASTFLGDYRTLIKNKDGDIKYVISHNNKWMQKKALEAIEAKFPRKDFVYEELPFQRKNQRFDRDADAGFRILMDTLAKDDPTSIAIRDAYVAWKDKTAGHYLGQSQHAKAKSVEAVGGAEGLKLEKSFEQNAADSIQAQIRFFENSFQAAEMGKATHNLYKLLEDQTLRDNKPNSVAYALDYIENARGWRNNSLGKFSKLIEEAFGEVGLGTNAPSQISSIVRSFLNAKLLGGWNPAFWYVNLVQMVNALPEMASVSGRIGDPSWAMAKFSEGSMKMLTNKLHTDPFWKEASDWARDHGISKSAIDIDTADIGKWKGMHTIDTVWNGPRRVIEEQTRRMVFGAFLEVLKDHYPKDQAFRMAASGVERSLGDYRPFEKAMGFESGGFMGKNSGFLRTYTMNAFSQLGANLKSHEYGNFLKLFGILAFSSGVSGMIGVQQADWMINRYNEWFASKTGVRIPSVKEFLLKNGGKYFGKYADAVTFGPHSTLMDKVLPGGGGVDLSGRMGFQNIAPESLADLAMPGAGDLGKLAASGAKTLMNPTSKDSWAQLAHAAAPSSLKFLSESALERPDSQGKLKLVSPSSGQLTNYSRTDSDNTIRKFNARSVNESKALSKDFAHVSEERQLTKLRNDVMDKFGKEHAAAKNNFEVHKLAKAAADKYLELGGNPDGVVEALEAAILKYKLTPKQREDLNANPMVIKRRQEYGN